MPQARIKAEVISCPGQLGNATYRALHLSVEGFDSPFALTLAMRALGYQALAEQADPDALFKELASAVNRAQIAVDLARVRNEATVRRIR